MPERPQRREQPWLQHDGMAGEMVAELTAEVTPMSAKRSADAA